MKRDMDLVRELLLRLEAIDIPAGVLRPVSPHNPAFAFESHSPDDIGRHFAMLVSGGFVETGSPRPFGPDGSLMFRQLTWAGHDFLDSVRDPVLWKQTKDGALKAGGWTFELLKQLATGYAKLKIEEITGVKL